MAHIFIVNERTFKIHLENMFAGTGAGNKESSYLFTPSLSLHWKTKQILSGLNADISKVRIGDKVGFFVMANRYSPGTFYGLFEIASEPFLDLNDGKNYLRKELGRPLEYRVLIKPYKVYAKGISEHEFLDNIGNKNHPYEICWSLIYRKLIGLRGCSAIFDYEFNDLATKLNQVNNSQSLSGNSFTFLNNEIQQNPTTTPTYSGRQDSLDISFALNENITYWRAFEYHLQTYILQNYNKQPLKTKLIPNNRKLLWIGNEVGCGFGMQKMDILMIQEDNSSFYIRIFELKDEAAYGGIITYQLPWYIEWTRQYLVPNYKQKKVIIEPVVIAQGSNPEFNYELNSDVSIQYPDCLVEKTKLITFTTQAGAVIF